MLKPKAVEMYPVYICDDCSSRHCETLEYVNKIGKILCGCGKVLELKPIETFKVSPVFKSVARKSLSTKNNITSETLENDFLIIKESGRNESEQPSQLKKEDTTYTVIEKIDYDKAVDLLISLGYQKTESKKKIDDCVKSWMNEKPFEPIDSDNFDTFAKNLMFGKA
tara:strand:- start:1445 stop:1945 length:501 start_codon:yes stop_codon:yes gene_type:complete